MTPELPHLLHAGFDSLDVSFQGALPKETLDDLMELKEIAVKEQEHQPTTIGTVKGQLLKSGQQGGYAFVFNTGPLGGLWTFKNNTDHREWNVGFSSHASALAAYGYHGTKDRIYQALADMNCTALRESIRRIDFATDFLMPEHFQAHIEQVACHSHTKVAPYWGEVENPDQDPNKPTVVTRGRKIESITIGKMPGRQAIIYNKRKAAIEQGKTFWFKVWDIDPTDTSKKIWRVELRAGKRELKDKWQLTTFQDIEDCIGDVFAEATDQIRYLDDHQTDQNISRQTLHPLWQAVLKAHEENLCDYRAGITPNQLKEIIKERQIEIHLQQIIGNAASIAALEQLTDTEIREEFSGQIMQTLQNNIDSPQTVFWEGKGRAHRRHVQIA